MSDWIPDGKPDWWETAENFFKSPEDTVRSWIATWIVGGLITIYLGMLGPVTVLYERIEGVIWTIQGAFSTLVSGFYRPLNLLTSSLEFLFETVVTASGPFAIFVGMAIFAVVALTLATIARTIIRVIPVL